MEPFGDVTEAGKETAKSATPDQMLSQGIKETFTIKSFSSNRIQDIMPHLFLEKQTMATNIQHANICFAIASKFPSQMSTKELQPFS